MCARVWPPRPWNRCLVLRAGSLFVVVAAAAAAVAAVVVAAAFDLSDIQIKMTHSLFSYINFFVIHMR
jgi:hypothetical protein